MAESTTPVERTQAIAHLKFARMGPRKLRRVADAIRGKKVHEALVLLQFSGVFAAQPIEKLIRSAIANAANNHNMNTDELYVTRITVDGGPGGKFTKRLDPRAQGRANFKRKRLSHVTVMVGAAPPRRVRKLRGGAAVSVKRHTRRMAATPDTKTAAKKPATRKKSAGLGKPSRKRAGRT